MDRADKTYLLMDDFLIHLMTSCCNAINKYGSEVDCILGGYTSRLQVMDVRVNKPFKGNVTEAYENFMIGNPENRKVKREDIAQWINTGWEEVKVETITRTWNKIGINVQDIVMIQNEVISLLNNSFSYNCTSFIIITIIIIIISYSVTMS